jgi:hypothetical protein
MKTFSILFIVLGCLTGCHGSKREHQRLHKNAGVFARIDTALNGNITYTPNLLRTPIDSQPILLSYFDSMPKPIPHGGEFYTYAATSISLKKYIFVSDGSFGIIRIGSNDIYVAKNYGKSIEIAGDTFKNVYHGNGYSIILYTKVLRNGNGMSYEKGRLTISNIKYDTTISIHGGYQISSNFYY